MGRHVRSSARPQDAKVLDHAGSTLQAIRNVERLEMKLQPYLCASPGSIAAIVLHSCLSSGIIVAVPLHTEIYSSGVSLGLCQWWFGLYRSRRWFINQRCGNTPRIYRRPRLDRLKPAFLRRLCLCGLNNLAFATRLQLVCNRLWCIQDRLRPDCSNRLCTRYVDREAYTYKEERRAHCKLRGNLSHAMLEPLGFNDQPNIRHLPSAAETRPR